MSGTLTSSALRAAEAFSRSVLRLLELALSVPDHTTLSRRGRAFAERQPRVLASADPVHLVLDSTGLELLYSDKASGMPRSTADCAGNGASSTWLSMLARARSQPLAGRGSRRRCALRRPSISRAD